MKTAVYDLDVVPGGQPVIIPIKQYEDDYVIVLNLYSRKNNLAIAENSIAILRGTKKDGNGISLDAVLDISTKTISFAVIKQIVAVAGLTPFEIVIKDINNKETITATFYLEIWETACDLETTSDSVIRELYNIDQNFEEIIKSANDIKNAMPEIKSEVNKATNTANTALIKSSELENQVAGFQSDIGSVLTDVENLKLKIDGKIDEAYVENGVLYLLANGEIVAEVTGIGGGSGGGGTGNNAILTVANMTGWLTKAITKSDDCKIKFNWSSLENNMSTGNGTLKIAVNNVTKTMIDIKQGDVETDIAKYLSVGSNIVKITVSDIYNNSRSINYSINVLDLSISSTFDATQVQKGAFVFPYTPQGAISKTVHLLIDNTEILNVTTAISGRQLSFAVPAQAHGSHKLECYFDCEVNGQQVTSNKLSYDIICLETLNNTVVIACNFNQAQVTQYSTIAINYLVYNPQSLSADVTLKENDNVIANLTVDRTQQTWSYKASKKGSKTLKIVAGNTEKTISFTVIESEINIEAVAEDLELFLSSAGRSNNADNKSEWKYNNIKATLSNFNYVSDGWVLDGNKDVCLRIANDARVTIPLKMFASDFRTTGKTIEIEFATRDVMKQDAIVLSCMSDNRGIQLTAQEATIMSEQSKTSVKYKENEHLRISFVIEKRAKNRLVYLYVNGVMCNPVQYPVNDDFSQQVPVDIVIGSNDCTIDIYNIRVYNNDLTRYQILDNFIADTQNVDTMLERYTRNSIFDEYGKIVINKLPKYLPYLVLEAKELPQYKGDKKTISGTYVDPMHPELCFTFAEAVANVQGTSSQYYARKNYKINFKKGFVMTATGETKSGFAIHEGIPVSTFTFKADVASSEGCNNTELVKLYCDSAPFKTLPQKDNDKIRLGIDGFPIVVFWNNGTETIFLGKYNFNNDKGTEEVYGFTEGCESWEILNNTGNRVLFKESSYEDGTWLNDFEGRFPDGNEDYTNLKVFTDWLVSTDTTQATNATLTESKTYAGTQYITDNADYRIAKFKAELADYTNLDAILFNYLFTELFLMVDSRAKNMFPTFYLDKKWLILPYDFDTAIGINNEGSLVFSYNLEDIDHLESGADIFNGQQSVLWTNLRTCFYSEIANMYKDLRSKNKLSYADTEKRFADHQAIWSEAIFNEDGQYKYIDPLINDGNSSYLSMAQGDKASQRKWWLYNRFKYLDSKYNAGDALSDVITLRGYAKDDITVVPYADIYASVKYGSYLTQKRALVKNGESYTLKCPLDNVNDTEIYIYSASQLKSVGDLSGLKVGYTDFSLATNLQEVILGQDISGYSNGNLTEVHFGNNVMLQKVIIENSPNLTQTVDLSGCTSLKEISLKGTSVAGVNLANGSNLQKLTLPDTITALLLLNHKNLTDLVIAGYNNLTTVRIEYINSAIDTKEIVNNIADNSRLRIIGFNWSIASEDELNILFKKLNNMRGLDESGNNTEIAQLSGTINIDTITGTTIAKIQERYLDVNFNYNHITSTLYFYTEDGSKLLYQQSITDGGDGVYNADIPTKASTAQYTFTFSGWSLTPGGSANVNALKNVVADRKVYASFSKTVRTYTVYFYNGSKLLQTVKNVKYGGYATYTGDTPVSSEGSAEDYPFQGFLPDGKNITGDTSCYAQFGSPIFIEEITDSWETIIENITNNTYKNKYKIGNYKKLTVSNNGYDVDMAFFIADFDSAETDEDTKNIAFVSSVIDVKSINTNIFLNFTTKYYSPVKSETNHELENVLNKFLENVYNCIPDNALKNHIINTKKRTIKYNDLKENVNKKMSLLSAHEVGKALYGYTLDTNDYIYKVYTTKNKIAYFFSNNELVPIISSRRVVLHDYPTMVKNDGNFYRLDGQLASVNYRSDTKPTVSLESSGGKNYGSYYNVQYIIAQFLLGGDT